MIAWLVETLVATTALMLLVLAVREPVRRLFGSHVAYALWLLPALRMIMPPFASLLPRSVQETAVVQSSGVVTELVRVRIAELAPTVVSAAPAPEAGFAAAANWPIIIAGLWLLGLLVFALNQWLAYRRFCGFILSEATPRAELAPGILLVTSPRAKGPMAFGLCRRFIVLPEDAEKRFDEEERAMALAHELAHHARGDLFANAAALALLTLHWCNPVAWFAYRAFRNDQEMACDADVIDAVRGSALGHAYGRALVKSASGLEFAAVCNLTTVDRLKRRLAMLSNKSLSNRRRKTGFLIAGSVVIGGLVLTASGESMAAQVGAKVSEALPIPSLETGLVHGALASLPAVPALPALYATPPKVPAVPEVPTVPRAGQRAQAAGVDAVPPVPPVPPAPHAAPTPPTPPVPPASPAADGEHIERTVTVTVDNDGKRSRKVTVRHGDDPAEVIALDDLPEVRSASCGTGKSGEPLIETKDGERRVMLVCRDRIELAARDEERVAMQQKALALRSALVGLQSAKASIEADRALSARERARALASIEEAIAELHDDDDDD